MIVLIIKTLLLAHLISHFEPLKEFLEYIKPYKKNKYKMFLHSNISRASTCIYCCSLYIGFIMGGFWIGIISTYIAFLYSKLLEHKINKIRLQ